MADARVDFTDSAAYERFMGRWSRAVAPRFLQWIAPPRRAQWLDVGCGTGILVEALLALCDPLSIVGVDTSRAQVEQAAQGPAGRRAKFQQADAMALPFAGASFDVAVAALVLNFLAQPVRALQEMRRVTRAGGVVAGYVWDFTAELSPSGPLRRSLRALGTDVPAIPGSAHSSLEALRSLFAHAGLHGVEAKSVEVTLAYADFEDFWDAQTPGYSPTTKIINAMTEAQLRRLKRTVHESLPRGPNGKIEYSARANAVRATASA